VPHNPHELGVPLQDGSALPPPALEANRESFLDSLVEAQCGHWVPSQLAERTRTSLSLSHCAQ